MHVSTSFLCVCLQFFFVLYFVVVRVGLTRICIISFAFGFSPFSSFGSLMFRHSICINMQTHRHAIRQMDHSRQRNKVKKKKRKIERTTNEKLKYQQRVRFYVFLSLRRARCVVVWKIVCGFVFPFPHFFFVFFPLLFLFLRFR